jgi:hypothetical protein
MHRRVLLLLLVAALWSAASAHAQTLSLLVVQASPSETAVVLVGGETAGTAKVRVSVPGGFTLNVARPVGAVVGRGGLDLASAATPGGEGSATTGDIVVADPARYAANARVQACAPGPHAAVWRIEPLDVPIFVDPATGPDAALGGYDLQVCFDLPRGLSFEALFLDLERTVVPPATPGIYVWRAFVTPMTATGATDEGATWEVRGIVPWPAVLSLNARRAKGKGRYLLSGRLLLAGRPRGAATVAIIRFDPAISSGTVFVIGRGTGVKTNRNGRFRKVVRVKRRTGFFAVWFPVPREGCSSPATAPGGCLSETTAPVGSRPVIVQPASG